jgi:hypothetical protein
MVSVRFFDAAGTEDGLEALMNPSVGLTGELVLLALLSD